MEGPCPGQCSPDLSAGCDGSCSPLSRLPSRPPPSRSSAWTPMKRSRRRLGRGRGRGRERGRGRGRWGLTGRRLETCHGGPISAGGAPLSRWVSLLRKLALVCVSLPCVLSLLLTSCIPPDPLSRSLSFSLSLSRSFSLSLSLSLSLFLSLPLSLAHSTCCCGSWRTRSRGASSTSSLSTLPARRPCATCARPCSALTSAAFSDRPSQPLSARACCSRGRPPPPSLSFSPRPW